MLSIDVRTPNSLKADLDRDFEQLLIVPFCQLATFTAKVKPLKLKPFKGFGEQSKGLRYSQSIIQSHTVYTLTYIDHKEINGFS